MSKILVIDDDEDICTLLHTLLTDEGFQVMVTPYRGRRPGSAEAGRGLADLPGSDDAEDHRTGGPSAAALRSRLFDHNKVVVMFSSWLRVTEVSAEHSQIVATVLPKPFELDQVLALARQLTTGGL